MSKIPAVQSADYGRLEGARADMGWLLAEDKFREVFAGPHEYCGPWDQAQSAYGCFKQNDPVAWARGMNQIIAVLNDLPEQCSKADLRSAFGIL